MKRLLLSGYYGYGNAGDEAVLAGLAQGFREIAPAGELYVAALSGNPSETRRMHGIEAADRYRPAALLRATARCDTFLSGGGSLLQDVTSAHGIFYYLAVVRLAQALGKKTMFIAQGIGPLTRPRSRRLVAAVANKLNFITVRDPDSAQLLRNIGVSRPPLEVTADPALLLSPGAVPKAGGFGVALRPWQGQESLGAEAAAACFRSLAGQTPRLLAMQPESDGAAAAQFAAEWGRRGGPPAERLEPGGLEPLLRSIAGCDMMVGMRLHALILAAAAGVPSAALSYDPKVTAFMTASGQGDAVYDLSAPKAEVLAEMVGRVWAERGARAEALAAALPGLRAQARRSCEAAAGL